MKNTLTIDAIFRLGLVIILLCLYFYTELSVEDVFMAFIGYIIIEQIGSVLNYHFDKKFHKVLEESKDV